MDPSTHLIDYTLDTCLEIEAYKNVTKIKYDISAHFGVHGPQVMSPPVLEEELFYSFNLWETD